MPVLISHGNFLQYDRAKRPQAFNWYGQTSTFVTFFFGNANTCFFSFWQIIRIDTVIELKYLRALAIENKQLMQVWTYNYRRNPATRREHFQLSKLFCFFPKVFCKSPEVDQTSVDAIGVTLVLVDYNQNVPKSNRPQLN